MFRRILIALIVLVILVIVVGVVWFFYFADTGANGEGEPRSGNPIVNFFFPAGESDRTDSDRQRATTTGGEPGDVPVFRQVSREPVAGFVIFATESGETAIRYIERATGNVYETAVETPTSERLTNTTLPRIQETAWLPGGDALFIRYLNEDRSAIQTFRGTIAGATTTESGERELAGEFFPQGITELVMSPDGGQIFTLSENQSGSVGLTMDADGTDAVEVFNTPSAAWNASWPIENTIAFTTEPSREAFGFLYFLGLNGGGFEKVLGNIPGLTVNVSPDAETLIYSEGYRNTFRTFTYNRGSGEQTPFPINTLPEKCVWSTEESRVAYCAAPQNIPEGRYPDAWYQGSISFADALWRVDIDAEIAELVYTPEQSLDIVSLELSENDTHLLFKDKKTGSLWSLDLQSVE